MILNSVGLTISQVVGLPASYVTVWFKESRRLKAVTRELSSGAIEVKYGIDAPADSIAAFPDVGAVEAIMDSVDVSSFASLLQDNIDSNVGVGEYSVQVLAITSIAVEAEVAESAPEGSDDTVSSSTATLFIIGGVGCCVGCQIPILVLFWRVRSRRAARPGPEENGPAQGGLAKRGRGAQGVQLPDAPSPPPERPELAPGSVVELQGSRTFSHLNGRLGKIVKWMPSRGRYMVEFADGTRKEIWPANLALAKAIPPASEEFRVDITELPITHPTSAVPFRNEVSLFDITQLQRRSEVQAPSQPSRQVFSL